MKRISLILLSLVMVLSVMVMPAAAETTAVPTPDKNSIHEIQAYWWNEWNYKWPGYDAGDSAINDANRAPAKEYPTASSLNLGSTDVVDIQVATVADLVAIQTAVNSGNTLEGKVFHQTADLDLEAAEIENWMPIGYKTATASYSFNGRYNGWGYKISNLTIYAEYLDVADVLTVGLFGYATPKVDFAGGDGAQFSWIVIENPMIKGNVYKEPGNYVTGALCAEGGSYRACNVTGDNASFVRGSCLVGGLVGKTGEQAWQIQNSGVQVLAESNWTTAGGVIGLGGWVTRALNAGNVSSLENGQSSMGGIVGERASQIEYSINLGNITTWANYAGGTVGGICGVIWGNNYGSNNVNYGTVQSTAGSPTTRIGSIYGAARTPATGTYENLLNFGVAKQASGVLMGLIGVYEDGASASNVNWETCIDHGMTNMLKVRYQTNAENSVRLSVATDSLDYETVVFEITYQGVTKEVDCRKVCESILAADATLTAADLTGSDIAKYIVTFNLINIPENATFTVAAKIITPEDYPHAQQYYLWHHSAPVTIEMGA